MTEIKNHIDIYNLYATIPWRRSLEKAADDPVYQPFLTFEDREGYVAWRAEWRKLYAELSVAIREARKTWRAEGSEHDSRLSSALFTNRARARALLALRRASKVRAGELRAAAKEASSQVA